MASPEQIEWEEITAAVRVEISKHVKLMFAMNPGEINSFIAAIDTAMWLEIKAVTYDNSIEERKKTLERTIDFGG